VAGRITRRELKTDKFAVEVEHTVDFVTEHRRELIIYGSVVVAVVLISVGIYFFQRHQHAVREQALADAIQIQEAPVGPPNPGAIIVFPTEEAKRAAAAKAFGDVASKYSGSAEAATAKYYLGATAADQGNMAEAEKRFKEAAEAGDKNYSSLARYSLAQVYVAEGRSADAEKILRDLMAHPTLFVSKDQATISLARTIAHTKPDEARKLLEPLRTQTGPVSQAAINALGELPGQ
jgi:predicted negative regulator of RcsB-dependent stress response